MFGLTGALHASIPVFLREDLKSVITDGTDPLEKSYADCVGRLIEPCIVVWRNTIINKDVMSNPLYASLCDMLKYGWERGSNDTDSMHIKRRMMTQAIIEAARKTEWTDIRHFMTALAWLCATLCELIYDSTQDVALCHACIETVAVAVNTDGITEWLGKMGRIMIIWSVKECAPTADELPSMAFPGTTEWVNNLWKVVNIAQQGVMIAAAGYLALKVFTGR